MVKQQKDFKSEDEPNLKLEFVKKIERIRKQRSIRVDDFAKFYNL
jgi:hypothetical protein